ncbi:MAG: S-layer homology domain-containing protein [Oscillospiraceae bacterium]|nr:S-layer homology domain-containing protein [Oscillospiraceae bacterium]
MKKHLSHLLCLMLALAVLASTAGAAEVRYQTCEFGYNGNSGSLIRMILSSGRPRTDLSVISDYDANGTEHTDIKRTTVYTPAAGAVMQEILINDDGTSAGSAAFISCNAELVNGYGLKIQESGQTATLHSGDTLDSALAEGCNLLLYRRQVASNYEYNIVLYFDSDSTSVTPGSSGTAPGSSTTVPGSTTTTPVPSVSVPTEPDKSETPAVSQKGSLVTGSADMPQLSKQEIIDLLEENSLTLPGQVFDSQPSCSAPYQQGKLSDAALQAALNRLNALRRIAGMPATSLDRSWCESAQYGATILGKLGTLNHTPAQPADMDKSFYDKAYSATHSSNLSAGRPLLSAVDGLMSDDSASNIASTGHRRWQLSPALQKVGFGYVNNGNGYKHFTDVKVFDRGAGVSGAHSVSYDSFGWPSAGNFPNDLAAFTNKSPWTVSLNPAVYAVPSGITVNISGGGRSWTLSGSYQPSDTGAYLGVTPADNWNYGNNHCITFRPEGVTKYEGVYTVEIQGLKYKNNSPAPFTYTVDFFSTQQSAASAAPGTPSVPAAPDTPDTSSAKNPFTDVPAGAYYTDAVLWAYSHDPQIASGTTATTFSPYATCTRGQVVTFLWRAMGEPEPQTRTNPFQDVKTSDYYYKPVLWAYENNITTGTAPAAFSPRDTCTNGQVVTFLWRANGKPAASGSSSLAQSLPNSYYTDAVAWADSNGLLENMGSAFNPGSQSPRANIVTYLYRNLAE